MGAEEEREIGLKKSGSSKKILSHFEQEEECYPHVFMMHNNGPKY